MRNQPVGYAKFLKIARGLYHAGVAAQEPGQVVAKDGRPSVPHFARAATLESMSAVYASAKDSHPHMVCLTINVFTTETFINKRAFLHVVT